MEFETLLNNYYTSLTKYGNYEETVQLTTKDGVSCEIKGKNLSDGCDSYIIDYKEGESRNVTLNPTQFTELSDDDARSVINAMASCVNLVPLRQMFENIIDFVLAWRSKETGTLTIRVHEMNVETSVGDIRVTFKDKASKVVNSNASLELSLKGETKEFKFVNLCNLNDEDKEWFKSAYTQIKQSYSDYLKDCDFKLCWTI